MVLAIFILYLYRVTSPQRFQLPLSTTCILAERSPPHVSRYRGVGKGADEERERLPTWDRQVLDKRDDTSKSRESMLGAYL
jgi:hypothetical protein